MTVLPDNATPPEPTVRPEPNTKLGQLLALHDQLKAAAKHAENMFEACKAAIKAEATAAAPGARAVVVDSPDLAEPLRVFYSPRKRCNTKKMAAERPDVFAVYQAYQEETPSWTVKAVQR
ncbi:hypothetical protein [Labedaea rhizosphaerae]|uniref:Uncharacterized protein n=1 Tax=Labedaea rhizosphaerae TaxID=598644 RepID=A0A4R6SCI8_LABRH|nr:hypothetical protein [Labedaea rhizosphaerae]TDP97671.1 hypothetical protein EV186_103635 [Labedaea rhizosphaerae]